MPRRVIRLRNLGVDVLICGAISRPLAFMITGLGIELLPHIRGRIDEVLNAYLTSRLTEQRFSMPGCKAGSRKRFRGRGRGQGRRRGCRGQW
jgi:predicted Fe-Mo cluster-binding NifX family protein